LAKVGSFVRVSSLSTGKDSVPEKIETMDSKTPLKDEHFQIQGAIFEVYWKMGCGFPEAIYQECLTNALSKRRIPSAARFECNKSTKTIYIVNSNLLISP